MMGLDDLLDPTAGLSVLMFLIAGMILRSKRPKVPLWSLMAFTAFVVVISGLVPLEAIAEVIDMDVVLFLIGIFSIVAVAESSGLLDWRVHFLVSNPQDVLRRVDWGTIVFFMAMFITMSGVWKSGVLSPLLSLLMPYKNAWPLDYFGIVLCSLLISQLLSNVPFTKLFLDYMKSLGYSSLDVKSWIALAMASTIAGNLTILGAASNVIILEVLEARYGKTISFTEFFKAGTVVTAVNIAIYTIFLLFLA